jgi:sigma-B regulation protein RsbU (phosphoserine phosphatase)
MTARQPGRAGPHGRRRDVAALFGALALLAALVTAQLVVGGRLVVVPWLALSPLAASLLLRWRLTIVAAVASVAAVAWLSANTGDLDTYQGIVRVLGSTALAGFAVLSAAVRVRREQHVRRVAQVAAVAQAAILHPVPAEVGGVVLASRYVSATTDALVGGDLYDVVAFGGGVRIIVGDARGKGLAALHTSAAVLSAFRHAAPQAGQGLDDVARSIEAAILPALEEEDFVTAVLCEVHPDGRLDLVRCGHPSPLRLVPGRVPVEVGAHAGPPLGLGVVPLVETDVLRPGERLLLYTDGLVEARNRHGVFFDLPAAAGALAGSGGAPTADALDRQLDRLLGQVRAHVGGRLDDDVAALLVEPLPVVPPGPRVLDLAETGAGA